MTWLYATGWGRPGNEATFGYTVCSIFVVAFVLRPLSLEYKELVCSTFSDASMNQASTNLGTCSDTGISGFFEGVDMQHPMRECFSNHFS